MSAGGQFWPRLFPLDAPILTRKNKIENSSDEENKVADGGTSTGGLVAGRHIIYHIPQAMGLKHHDNCEPLGELPHPS